METIPLVALVISALCNIFLVGIGVALLVKLTELHKGK